MSNFSKAEKMMKAWDKKTESNEKKIQKVWKTAGEKVKASQHKQFQMKQKFMELHIKNARLAAENKQNAKTAHYMQQQLLHNRTNETTVVSEAMRLIGVVNGPANKSMDQNTSQDGGSK